MRLTEIGRLASRRGATSYLQKRGFALPAIAVGAMLPGQIADAIQRYEDIEQSLNRAGGEPLDASVAEKRSSFYSTSSGPAAPPSAGGGGGWGGILRGMAGAKPMPSASSSQLGQQVAGQLLGAVAKPLISAPFEGIAERLKSVFAPKPPSMLSQIQTTATESLGKSIGTAGADLIRDIAAKALSIAGGMGAQTARAAIVQTLKNEDPILAEADDAKLMEAYHTMVRFAPVLSTDKNAVRSFLRQSVMTGAGPDYASIKLLADSERAVTGGGE